MDIKDIMEIDVSNLRDKQFQALKAHTVSILTRITDCIKLDMFEEAMTFLEDSPAGDGYGCDNKFINFAYVEDQIMDLGDVLEKLEYLKK